MKHAVDLRDKDADYSILEPIVIAASEGHLEIVRLLLDHRANIEVKTFWVSEAEGGNALQAAVRDGYLDIMELLLQRVQIWKSTMKVTAKPLSCWPVMPVQPSPFWIMGHMQMFKT